MNDLSALKSDLQHRISSRSMGLKLIVVCGLALLMMVPTLFVSQLIDERASRAQTVMNEISGHVGGQQTFLGPTLTIPYTIPPQVLTDLPKHGVYIVFPVQGSGLVKVKTEERRRSLFKVPIFQADLNLDSSFDLTGVPSALPDRAELDWAGSEIVVGVGDVRGALADAAVTVNGKTINLIPAENAADLSGNDQGAAPLKLTLLSAKAGDIARPDAQFQVRSVLRFSGARRIAVLAYGKATRLQVDGDWPNPSFDGGFLPVKRTITSQGFSSEWSVPFIARGVRSEGRANTITGLNATALGVSFVELADPYQSVNRSLKYALLFMGLVFLSYFIFEVTTSKRVHPAQYLLVGIAQVIFYLLLLSLAERIGFDLGFLFAGAATVILLSANAGWLFDSRTQAVRAFAGFSLLYGLIYMLLRLEDNALLVGAVASFLVVAAAMYFTRKIDWYSSFPATRPHPGANETASE